MLPEFNGLSKKAIISYIVARATRKICLTPSNDTLSDIARRSGPRCRSFVPNLPSYPPHDPADRLASTPWDTYLSNENLNDMFSSLTWNDFYL